MRFTEPAASTLLDRAEAEGEALDVEFLWKSAAKTNSASASWPRILRPSAGRGGIRAILLRLHAAPIYFHRKGRGRFRKAPPEILQAALAGLEKRQQSRIGRARMREELLAGRLPEDFRPMLRQILYRPDRNRLGSQGARSCGVDAGLSAARLLMRCGALASSHDFYYGRFLFEYFPEGTDFPAFDSAVMPGDLPRAEVAAFSIDDATTTEIDDAFSITPREGGGWRIGIHIAAPSLGFGRGSSLDEIARSRLSTVYMPGRKITMLPDEVVAQFTLAAGRDRRRFRSTSMSARRWRSSVMKAGSRWCDRRQPAPS